MGVEGSSEGLLAEEWVGHDGRGGGGCPGLSLAEVWPLLQSLEGGGSCPRGSGKGSCPPFLRLCTFGQFFRDLAFKDETNRVYWQTPVK